MARNKKHLLSAQRQVLIWTTKAYAICFPVVAGVFPIDLYLSRRVHKYRVRREQPTVIRQVEIVEEMYTDPDGRDEARRLIDEQLVEEWQERWDSSERGRTTYAYFPRIGARLRTRWFVPCHSDGHGPWVL